MEENMKTKIKPYEKYIKVSKDLVTTYEAKRAGFVALVLEKNRKANPFIAEARALKIEAEKCDNPKELLKIRLIKNALITASGISDKALNYLNEDDILDIIDKELIEKFLIPAGTEFIEELVYRFLLTKGDQLGGIMRNLGGKLGERKFSRSIISVLKILSINYSWLDSESKKWLKEPTDDADIELRVNGVSWKYNKLDRTLLFNRKVPFIGDDGKGKNVDFCLLSVSPNELKKRGSTSPLKEAENYIALGELKSGIDPAGADEHWKTAHSALRRIRKSFQAKSLNPATFFIGAAIENSMAGEIYSQLKENNLSNAANLTNDNQVAALCNWLVTL